MGTRLDQITDWEALARLAGYRAGEMAALRGVSAGHFRRLFRDLLRVSSKTEQIG
jgi:AraC-like DNA-binding protein